MSHPKVSERFEPRAGRAMASMFDGVTGRYDLLNGLMTLGQDRAWRLAMARQVPAGARVVLDLCTGNGVSLEGLRRPGRLLIGLDVSLGMLESAAEDEPGHGWSPRIVCGDGFRLPLASGAVDAVTIGFGIRNLRPRSEALAEIRRVLAPGGTLVVLEAAAPAPGPLAPLHRFHLARVVPLLGRLSPDPSAYRYLAESILEFGDGSALRRDLAAAGFAVRAERSFLAGATRLWTATLAAGRGEKPSETGRFVQGARWDDGSAGKVAQAVSPSEAEARGWNAAQAVVSATLTAALVWGMVEFAKANADLPLEPWQRSAGWVLLAVGTTFAAVRTLLLLGRMGDRGPRR